jgi:WD40 repeat protein
LRRYLKGEAITARPVGATERAVKWARRRPAVAGLVALVALVGAAGLGGILWAYGEALDQRNAARGEARRADAKATEALREKKRADAKAAEALREKARADQKAADALREKERADERAYFAQVGRAEAQLAAADHLAAVSALDQVGPAYQRNWEYRYLRRQAEGAPLTLRGHSGTVYSVCYSPDGSRLASAFWDTTVKVWDARSGALLATLGGHTNVVTAVCYSPDGSRLASASDDGTVKVWDARSGAELVTLRGHTHRWVVAVCYSPDGTHLASALWDGAHPYEPGEVKVWDTRSGAEVATLRGHTGYVYSVAYSPDGSRLASASLDNTVKLWDAHSGAEVATLRGHTGWVSSVCYSPDGSRLASASYDRTVKVWDARSGAELATLRGHTGAVTAVCYSPDGSRLACASYREVKVWDARSGAELATLRGHPGWVSSVCYSPDGSRLAGASRDGTVKVWDTRSGAEVATLRGTFGGVYGVTSVCYSPDGTRLACASGLTIGIGQPGEVKVWDARSGAELATLGGHTDIVFSVCYSPDGSRLASASFDSTIKLWDARSGAELATLRGHTGAVYSVCYSPDGTRLASASGDSTVKVWDARSGAELASLRAHTGPVTAVAYSLDGTRLASASDDNTVKVWDARSGAELATLRGHTNHVHSVCYSPDGTRLASASVDNTVRVWDARSGAELATLRGHTGGVRSVSYSPDGTRLVSRDSSGTTLVWDAASGKRLPEPTPPRRLTTTNVSPDGTTAAVADGSLVRLYRRQPRPGADPWAEDHARHRALSPAWHAAQAAAAEKAGNTFAAAFHRRQLARGDNLRRLAWSRLADGDEPGCLQAIALLHRQYRLLASLAPAGPLFAALAAAPTPGISTAAAAPWEAEQRRLAAQLVRAAAVLPAGSVPAAELVTLARSGTTAEPQDGQARELLGAALYRAGRAAEAVAELEEAVRLHGKSGSLWSRLFLALAHRRLGHADKAQEYRRQALAASGWEEGVLQAQLLGELEDKLPEVLAGRARPASAAEAADLAGRCGYHKRLYVAATRLYAEAFTADPRLTEDLGPGGRYDAACFAALAAAGQGNDAATLGQLEQARLRRQAHDWLRADLQHWTKTLQAGKPEGRSAVLQQMQHWQRDADLAGVRDRAALAALPEEERRSWEQLWADVAALRDRAQQGK